MIDLVEAIKGKFPQISNKPGVNVIFKILKSITHEDEINNFIETNQHLRGFEFLDKILDYFNFSYNVSNRSLNRIPAEGRTIIIANHPIGSLDGLALLKLVRSVRPDVRIVANDLLSHVEPLKSLFLSVDNLDEGNIQKQHYKAMLESLENEEALIIFPAGEVSRIRPNGVKDGKWKKGFIKLAKKTSAPILPILVKAKNSLMFYSLSTLYKPLGTMMLAHEMFNKQNIEIAFHIGKAITYESTQKLQLDHKKLAKRFRKHLYHLGNKKPSKTLFDTIETVIHPIDKKAIKKELANAEILGQTQDGKTIFLYTYQHDSPVIHEIGRLRELAFRTVEEGTGQSIDLDKFDCYYKHLVLWDDHDLEIVGAYRLGECADIIEQKSVNGLYISTLFNLNPEIANYLPQSIELGRSFVQPRYWGRRSLDYLWFGIGAYVRNHPEVKYLLGPVSLSNSYPEEAKQLIIAFYQQQFGSWQELAEAKTSFSIKTDYHSMFLGDYKKNFKKLSLALASLNVKVPTLYKQYAEVCDNKGCHFIDFSIDQDFNQCIDSFILVELEKLKPSKAKRYIGSAIEN